MLRHLQKRQKLTNGGSDSDSDSDCDSDHSPSHGSSNGSQLQETQTDSDSETDHDQRIPPSLLKALDDPIIDPNDEQESSGDDSECEDTNQSQDSASQTRSAHESRSRLKLFPICLICPGKQLKTQNLLQEHLNSQAHKRRLERYRDFIQNPPPHTSLSPDPSEVIELIDALIGPPPVVPAGSITKKPKRKKRKSGKTPQEVRTNKNESINSIPQSGSGGSADTKLAKRRRSRRGKRERQEKLSKLQKNL